MAVSRGDVYVSPSVDIKTKAELDSTKIESGLYYCTEEITITATDALGSSISEISSRWTVICISTEYANSLNCYTQIWINSSTKPNHVFIRTLESDSSYSDFSLLVTADYLKNSGVLNGGTQPIELFVQSMSPGVKEGTTRIWIEHSD